MPETGGAGPPAGLCVELRPAAAAVPDAPLVVLVHGSLDRAASFRRVLRRLPEVTAATYDRRGYQRSRGSGPTDLLGHRDDLLELLAHLAPTRGPGILVGHSFGGDVALAAATTAPELVEAVAAYEPPLPWLGFTRPPGPAGDAGPTSRGVDPADQAERFFARMMGPGTWERLSREEQAGRRADGAALATELASIRGPAPFDVTALDVPAVLGCGGDGSAPHHRAAVAWLVDHLDDAELFEIPGAAHGAHLSHPDAFAAMVRRTVERSGHGSGGAERARAAADA